MSRNGRRAIRGCQAIHRWPGSTVGPEQSHSVDRSLVLVLDAPLAAPRELGCIEHRSLDKGHLEVPGRCRGDAVLVDYPENPRLCLARLANPPSSVPLEGERQIQPDAQPPGGIGSKVHSLVANSNASLAASVLSLPGEEDGLCLCRLEPNSISLSPPQASLAHPSSLAVTLSRSTPSTIQVTSSTKEIPRQSSIWLSAASWISAMYRAKSTGETGEP